MELAAKELVWPENYHICESARDLGRVARLISSHKSFAYDTETSGLNPWKDILYCVSIYVGGQSFLINFKHRGLPIISVDTFRSTLEDYFVNSEYYRCGFNTSFDGHFLLNSGVRVGYTSFDSEVASWLLRSDLPKGMRRLKPLCEMYLGGIHETYEEKFGNVEWIAGHPRVAAHYALHDAELHWRLYEKFESELVKIPPLHKLMHKLEMPLQAEFFESEHEGFLIDEDYVNNELGPQLESQLETILSELRELGLPEDINPNSPDQLGHYLFDILKLPVIGKRSTSKKVIEIFADKNPIVAKLLEYKSIHKLKTGFADKLAEMAINGKIYPTFRTIGTETGRPSSDKPNFLNLPVKAGPLIRKAIIADDDHIIVSKDISGQEQIILAHFCGPGPFQEVAMKGTLYSEVASEFYGIPSDQLKKGMPQRDNGKVAWLAMQYGAQAGKIKDIFGCSKEKAQEYITNLFYARFPEIGRYMDRCKSFAHQNGYVQTILGRRRTLDFNNCQNIFQVWEKERFAINSPVQGTAADQMKLAMLLCNRYLREYYPRSRARINIYDELVFWIHKEDWPVLDKVLDDIIVNAIQMSLPFTTSTEVYGKRWGQKEEDD